MSGQRLDADREAAIREAMADGDRTLGPVEAGAAIRDLLAELDAVRADLAAAERAAGAARADNRDLVEVRDYWRAGAAKAEGSLAVAAGQAERAIRETRTLRQIALAAKAWREAPYAAEAIRREDVFWDALAGWGDATADTDTTQ